MALCVAAYVAVLLVEMSPAFFEKWSATEPGVLGTVARRGLTVVNKALVWILALGLLLPTMHQSSLGTMMLLPASKLHPLWFTPWLPLLFMVNAIVMGFGAVVLESHIAARAFKRPIETAMLGKLAGAAFYVAAGWLAFRLVEVAIAGDVVHLGSWRGGAFIVETLLLVWALVLMTPARRGRPGDQFRSALLLVVAGTVFRVNVYLIGFQPGGNYSYFPALPELFITLGIIALEVALYVAAVRKFPILSGRSSVATAR